VAVCLRRLFERNFKKKRLPSALLIMHLEPKNDNQELDNLLAFYTTLSKNKQSNLLLDLKHLHTLKKFFGSFHIFVRCSIHRDFSLLFVIKFISLLTV